MYVRYGLPVFACLSLASCSSMSYYFQAVSGQMAIMHRQEPVADVITFNGTDPAVKEKLAFIQNILDFARDELFLPDHGSYRSYARVDRDYVVWNIFASPELSVEARQWCYLFVGCLSYRGYFSEARARLAAKGLKDDGWDVYVGGVSAYSTLGWFRDPVLNTMLDREKWEIARLIFHELAHQKIYINNDVDFNEAFADGVARIGLMRWLDGQPAAQKAFISIRLSHEDEFTDLVLLYRNRLSHIYTSARDDSAKRSEKKQLLDELQKDYEVLRQRWVNDDSYDAWMMSGVNNAKLAAVSTYRRLVPDIIHLFESTGRDFRAFYALVTSLGHCNKETRRTLLVQYPEMEIKCL